ncbi:SgcJ/EcaC family oxidoreductase [Sphaerisporangium perillae]|uniref:SgcJ/EcaC family oxidoreductase n=1 Tax=Sphaerisporangium perillae TaxID=2935860 RepID=UPI00200C5D75|nr:SgcJ/EcaC family oxidoreductase [Sphaerisporangium perillae]
MISNESSDTRTGTGDSGAVRDVLRRIYAAWADNDADAFAALYADDATVVMPGVFHRGRSAVRDYMAGAFAGPLKGSRAIDDPQDIRVIGGDTAIVVSKAGIVMAGERHFPAERERLATWVLSKQDGRWLVAAYANAPAR